MGGLEHPVYIQKSSKFRINCIFNFKVQFKYEIISLFLFWNKFQELNEGKFMYLHNKSGIYHTLFWKMVIEVIQPCNWQRTESIHNRFGQYSTIIMENVTGAAYIMLTYSEKVTDAICQHKLILRARERHYNQYSIPYVILWVFFF